MRTHGSERLRLAGLAMLIGPCTLLLGGCLSERATVPASEPTWSYRDGPIQLSNNDLWNEMVPETFFADATQTKVASAEEISE